MLGNVDGGSQIVRKLAALSGSSFESNLPGVQTAVRAVGGLTKVIGPERLPGYNYWDPSRVIPNTINEFPYWSFLFADLHPHMIGIGFTVLFLALAWSLLARSSRQPAPGMSGRLVGVDNLHRARGQRRWAIRRASADPGRAGGDQHLGPAHLLRPGCADLADARVADWPADGCAWAGHGADGAVFGRPAGHGLALLPALFCQLPGAGQQRRGVGTAVVGAGQVAQHVGLPGLHGAELSCWWSCDGGLGMARDGSRYGADAYSTSGDPESPTRSAEVRCAIRPCCAGCGWPWIASANWPGWCSGRRG